MKEINILYWQHNTKYTESSTMYHIQENHIKTYDVTKKDHMFC
jgi:hypothetical protein